MKKAHGARSPRQYPAHVYRHRWDSGHVLAGGFALGATVGMVVLFAHTFWLGLALGIVALFTWLVFCLVFAEKKRMYVCVDREGVEIARLFGIRHYDWSEIDDIWMIPSVRSDAVVIRLRNPGVRDVLIADLWDAPISTIFEHIERYRQRYGSEASATVSSV